jgi:hypothetical protein
MLIMPTTKEPIAAGSADTRRAARHKVLKPGVIVIHRRSTITCTVRNLSARGAKLEVPSVVGIPDMFELKVDGKTYTCRVVWRRLKELGVAFVAHR